MTFAPYRRITPFGQFVQDRRGASAIEFAIILPLMLMLYFGAVELSQGLSIDRKVTQAARTVTDLVTQSANVDGAAMNGIFEAAKSVMTPYTGSNLKVTVSAVDIDDKGQATIAWSKTLNGTEHSKGASVTLPTGLVIKSAQLIWGEVQYSYMPSWANAFSVIDKPINLADQIFMRPRLSDSVKGP